MDPYTDLISAVTACMYPHPSEIITTTPNSIDPSSLLPLKTAWPSMMLGILMGIAD